MLDTGAGAASPGEHGETGEVAGTFSNPSVEGDSQ